MQRVRGWSVAACLAMGGCAMSVAPPATLDEAKESAATAAQGVVLGPDTVVARHATASPGSYLADAFQAESQVTLEAHTLRFRTDAAYADEVDGAEVERNGA